MLIKSTKAVPAFLAGDKTTLRELLHPKNDHLDFGFSLAHCKVAVGNQSIPHTLAQSETYYILEGQGKIFIGEEEANLQKGDLVFVPAKKEQFIQNIGSTELVFLVIVSPPWTEEGEIILE